MTRDEVKSWLANKTESIDQTDIEKQSMIGEDIIDLMTDLVKNHGVSHHVSDSFLEIVKQKLFNDWAESLVSEEYDENIPEHWWLQDISISDMMEVLKSCLLYTSDAADE